MKAFSIILSNLLVYIYCLFIHLFFISKLQFFHFDFLLFIYHFYFIHLENQIIFTFYDFHPFLIAICFIQFVFISKTLYVHFINFIFNFPYSFYPHSKHLLIIIILRFHYFIFCFIFLIFKFRCFISLIYSIIFPSLNLTDQFILKTFFLFHSID